MKIAVMGAGSVGGYFGGMLARSNNQVSLIARGAHLQKILQDGLKMDTSEGVFTLNCPSDIEATDDPASVGPADLILLTVKTYHNEQAVAAMMPMAGPDTAALCLQNGMDSYRAAGEKLGMDKVLPGAAYIEAAVPSPGVVKQTGNVVRVVFGELDGVETPRCQRILSVLRESGIDAQLSLDIRASLWTKFLFIATMAGVTTTSRRTMAELIPQPEWRRVVEGCLREIEVVGRATGVDLADEIVFSTMKYIDDELENLGASMHADIMAGRPLELEALNGAVVRAGDAVGVSTPINDLIYAMLKPFMNGSNNC